MSRNIFHIALVLLLAAGSLFGQQDPQYSQYMFNGLVLNPAYAGSRNGVSSTFIYRQQWAGYTGAPSTQSFSLHGPSRNLRNGFGLFLLHDQIGPSRTYDLSLSYAFRIPLGDESSLALGLQGVADYYQFDPAGMLTSDQNSNDPVVSGGAYNVFQPNAGAGIYLNTPVFYAGVSSPRLLNVAHRDPALSGATGIRTRHYLATLGGIIGQGETIKFKPSAVFKYVEGGPFSFDVNASVLLVEKFWLGASYRWQDAVVFIAEWQVSQSFRFGYAYDLGISELSTYHNGSHELMLGFDFSFKNHKLTSPRYF